MQYFDVPRPSGNGVCSDNDCPCGFPGESIPRGTGYLYIPKEVVDFRRDARTLAQAQAKIGRMRQRLGGGVMMFGQGILTATLMCEQGARKRKLDMEVAAADAAHWWKTGKAPLRVTPISLYDTFTFLGRTEKQARDAAAKGMPSPRVHDIRVTQKVRTKSATAARKTAEGALKASRDKVPDDAFDVSEGEIVQEADQGTVKAEAYSQEDAQELCKQAAPTGASVKEATCVTEPSKGFLGVGKKPGVWQADWSKPFRAKVTYKLPAEVTVRVKR